jgi:hypothetical protein
VRHAARGFQEQQTLVGRGRKNPPPATLSRQGGIVIRVIESEEGKLKTVLPSLLPVTASRIAAMPAQEGNNLRGEIDVASGLDSFDLHWNRYGLSLVFHDNFSQPIP